MKTTYVFFITIFRASLQSYLILTTIGMTKNTLIKHKEAAVICQENGPIIANYNDLITQPESKPIAQPIVIYATVR